jgi:hypothetical protein
VSLQGHYPPVLTGARSASARTSAATRGHTAAGKSCPNPGRRISRAPALPDGDTLDRYPGIMARVLTGLLAPA